MEKIYFTVIKWGTYLAMLTPLIFIRSYFFPFVVPKTIFFRIIVDIIFIAYILLVISNPKYRPKFTPLTVAIAIFLGILVLTSITGVNFEKSFWSVFERMTGLITFFHLFIFYIILTSVFRERKYWERILSVSILICAIISLIVLISEDPTTRGGGTLGNSSFFSGYCLFNLFFAVVLLVGKSGIWRVFCGLAVILFLVSLFFNPGGFTKGAVAALISGAFILIVGFLMFYLLSSGKKKLKIAAFSLIVLVILGGLGFLQLNFTKEKIAEVWQSNSIQSRLVVWNIAWQGWQEKFWLGWGPENFNIPFAKYFDPKLPATGDLWYDRVHNVVLDTGVASGIVGLISYLSIFGVAIFGLFKLLPKITDKKNVFIPLGMTALMIVYFFQDFWVFDMVSSYMMFFLSLAFINFLIVPAEKEGVIIKKIPQSSLIGALLIIITVFTLIFGNIQSARASKFTIYGMSYPLEQSLDYFQKALAVSPIAQFEVPEQIVTRFTNFALEGNQNEELLIKGLKLSEEQMRKSVVSNPLDFRPRLFLGKFYNNLYQFTRDTKSLDLANEILGEAEKLSPKNQQVYWMQGQTKLFEVKKEEAIELFKKAVDLDPRFAQSRWYLFLSYKIAGKYDLALAELKEMEKLEFNWINDANNFKQVKDVYKALNENESLLSLYEKGVEIYPNEVQLWADLADLYAAKGEREKAKQAAEKIRELNPELAPQVEEFLKELGY